MRLLTSAPASISTFTASAWFSAAAHISAVWPAVGSTVSTVAPLASSIFTASALPVLAAVISTVSPSGMAVLASAPALRSAAIMAASPLVAARLSGCHAVPVGRLHVGAGTDQRFGDRHVAIANGQCRAVVPSASATLAFARCLSSARTVSVRPFLTASRSGLAVPAAAAVPAAQPGRPPHSGPPHRGWNREPPSRRFARCVQHSQPSRDTRNVDRTRRRPDGPC